MHKKSKKIYLLPGRGGRVDGFIGKILKDFSYEVEGHNLDDTFQKMRFSEQIKIIKKDLENHFSNKESKVIANSYGAYLFLHAILEMNDFQGKALLFSPMLGRSKIAENRPIVSPPRAKKLLKYKKDNNFPNINLEVHTGVNDEICDPQLAKDIFKEIPNCKLQLIPNASHRLDGEYIKRVISDFLKEF